MPSALSYVVASAYLVPGILALLIGNPGRSRVVGFGGGAVASFLGLVATLYGAMGGTPVRIPLPAPVPWAASELFLDGLSAFFLALIFFIGVYPKPFLDTMAPSIDRMIAQTKGRMHVAMVDPAMPEAPGVAAAGCCPGQAGQQAAASPVPAAQQVVVPAAAVEPVSHEVK